jgi:hypothetical protein
MREFYAEFARKIRNEKPNVQTAAGAVPIIDFPAPNTPLVVFKQKPT